MKLNFNFSGKTLLKDWWKIVRDNFTAIQTEHNTLSDKLDTEITQRTNADIGLADKITAETKARESADSSLSSRINNEVTIRQAADNELQRNIDSEIAERQTADTNISNSVKAEESARKSADKELKARIDEINANTETTILFGDKKQHTVKFVAPSKPTLYFDGQQEYYGESMAVDITLKDAFYIDGKQIAGTFSEPCINVPIDGIYIVVRYDFIKNTCSISSNSTSVPSAISGDVWTFTLYHIHDINLEMKIDSESPTGERYEFVSAAVDYAIENENTTGDSYFITNTYERVRTLADLATVNKNSFIDAVNENAKNITDIAKHLNVNPDYLSHLFKKQENITIKRYILKEKIRRSRNLLQYSDYCIQEISFYLGFSSQSHFCKVFQEMTGETPGRYRKQYVHRTKWKIV